MGVNFAKDAIIDYDLAEYNGKKEIIRRYLKEKYEYIYEGEKKENYLKVKKIMEENDIDINDDILIKTINEEKERRGLEVAGIELKNGEIITGKEKEDITKTAALVLNILKLGTNIEKQEYLIPKEYIKKVFDLKEKISKNSALDYVEVTECLIILTILSSNSKKIQDIIDNLDILKDKYSGVLSQSHVYEVLPKNNNKGTGLKKLAEKLGIKQEEVMAIGDGNNDVEMFEYANYSVAMENASDLAAKAAKYRTDSNTNDGVAKAIRKYALNK